ncbi:MAG: DNA-directed RNA polymerase subunit beta', partial [Candidatus Limnocylindrales bacterium]
HNIKSAKRIVERVRPEVWDVLEEVIKDHPVLLNRAPTLHRLGIQAFMPILVEGSAIQIHPLVCTAFNADFDGDQMAVHVPLSAAAQNEARTMMLSTANLLSPADGTPVVAPTQDMVLGCYYLTMERDVARKTVWSFADEDEALFAYELAARGLAGASERRSDATGASDTGVTRRLGLHEPIDVVVRAWDEDAGELRPVSVRTTVGRIIFNGIVPDRLRFKNQAMKRSELKKIVDDCYRLLGSDETANLVDGIKDVGFKFATRGGMTIGLWDIVTPVDKVSRLATTDTAVVEIDKQFSRGLITEDERYEQVVELWQRTTKDVSDSMMAALPEDNSLRMMTDSGARGNKGNIGQLGAMRGLMADPSGRIIDVPVRSNFREGMSVLEYFISTHGARKGLADTALRTADSGYLTRRLVDVAQDVITRDEDCGTEEGSWITAADTADMTGANWPPSDDGTRATVREEFRKRLVGRLSAAPLPNPASKAKNPSLLVDRNELITEEISKAIEAGAVDEVLVRSPLTCEARYGVCRRCYGRNLATGKPVGVGEAVGIIAAQSIGEPGTQLTMRTFHTGGVAGLDITAGLPRVEELFEARVPKGKAEISHIDGTVTVLRDGNTTKVKVTSREAYDSALGISAKAEFLAASGDQVEIGQVIARLAGDPVVDFTAPVAGFLTRTDDGFVIRAEDVVEREYGIPHNARLLDDDSQDIRAGDAITDGPINPQEYLDTRGRDAVQRYLVKEVQKVYRSQGVTINDKHIEIIVRQMLRKVRIDQPGDSELLPTELIDRLDFEEVNNRVLAEGGEPATAQAVLLGVTKASLNTSSFLAAASFQETTRVLTEAAINGAKDHLIGLKENVIIGKLIPAGSGAPANLAARKERERRAALEALAGEALEDGGAAFNPFLEDGATGPADEDAASSARPASVPASDEDGFNPFLTGVAAGSSDAIDPDQNPLLQGDGEATSKD